MKLRRRIALSTILVSAPMIAGLIALDVNGQQRAAEAELVELVAARAERAGERERCEAEPELWNRPPRFGRARGEGPGPEPRAGPEGRPPFHTHRAGGPVVRGPHRLPAEFFVYDAELKPLQPGWPALRDLRRSELPEEALTGRAQSSLWQPDRALVLVRTPWPGSRCGFVLARGTTEPWLGALLPPTRLWAAPTVMVFAVVLLVIGPVVQRIRRLTAAVQRFAAVEYSGQLALSGDDELSELARAFDAAGREVRAQLEAKDRRDRALRSFVADTTHDVAIPLTVLNGHLATLQDDAAARGTPAASALASAIDEAHYIGALLHNLGAAAELDAADPARVRGAVDLPALIQRVVSRHRPLARQRDVSLEAALPEEALRCEGDVTLLEQAVSNLVYNALRYNQSGGHVAVLLEATERGFRIRVLDDGPGVPEDTLARLRERGFRGSEARTRDATGRGLGLHITQRVADAHGMTLTFGCPEAGGLQVDLEGSSS